LHREWLTKQVIPVSDTEEVQPKYLPTEIENLISKLPTYLADYAYDMQEPRGTNAKTNNSSSLMKPTVGESTRQKRKYQR